MRRAAALALSSAAFFMGYYTRLAWGILSSYAGWSTSSLSAGLVFSLFFAAYVAVQIPAGIASDSLGPKPVVIAALLGLAASTALAGASNGVAAMYAASALMGFSAGWVYPATVKLMAALYGPDELPYAMSYYSLAWPLSIAALGVTAPEIAEALGWRGAYYAFASVDLAMAAAAALILPGSAGAGKSRQIELKAMGSRGAVLLAAGGFIFFAAYWAFAFYAYDYLLWLRIPSGVAGLIYSLTAIGGIPSTLIAGSVIQRLGIRRTYAVLLPLYGVLLAAYAAPFGVYYLAAVSLAAGFVRFMITPANSTAATLVGRDRAGSVAGLANLFWQAAGVASGVVAAPAISDLGYSGFWILAGALSAASAIVLTRLEV